MFFRLMRYDNRRKINEMKSARNSKCVGKYQYILPYFLFNFLENSCLKQN